MEELIWNFFSENYITNQYGNKLCFVFHEIQTSKMKLQSNLMFAKSNMFCRIK